MTMSAPELIDEVIEAHGGRQRWHAVERIEADFSSGGLAFALHMQPHALQGLRLVLHPHDRRVELHDFGQPGGCGLWTPNHVRMTDAGGALVAERHNPRASFKRIDRWLRWDKLDILYFAGYALWNYLGFPWLLEAPGVTLVESGRDKATCAGRLVARFDASFPTHSPIQTFHVDHAGRLTRHDYTADVISRWAAAANCCEASVEQDGLRFYTRRRVFPRLGAETVLPMPTLVWIEIDGLRVVSKADPVGT